MDRFYRYKFSIGLSSLILLLIIYVLITNQINYVNETTAAAQAVANPAYRQKLLGIDLKCSHVDIVHSTTPPLSYKVFDRLSATILDPPVYLFEYDHNIGKNPPYCLDEDTYFGLGYRPHESQYLVGIILITTTQVQPLYVDTEPRFTTIGTFNRNPTSVFNIQNPPPITIIGIAGVLLMICICIESYLTRRRHISNGAGKIIGLMVLIACGWPTRSYSDGAMPDITGVWAWDDAYTREYLKAASNLQKRWCGYGWSDAEIEKRAQLVESAGRVPKLSFKKLNGNTYMKTILPISGAPETTTLSHCTLAAGGRMRCDTGDHKFARRGFPDLDQEYFSREEQYLSVGGPTHKSMMRCAGSSEPPDEIEWIFFRYKRASD